MRLLRWVRRRPWRRIVLALALIWFTVSLGIALVVDRYGYEDHTRPSDAIIILGAGVNRNNTPTMAARARIRRGGELWQQGVAPNVICTGGLPGRATRTEADVCRELLEELGVPADRIFLEDRSRSTEENALYSREVMDAHGWKTAVVVSDQYHLLRADYLFHSVGIDAYTSPASWTYMRNVYQYVQSLSREVIAVEWQVFTDLFNLPVTYVPVV